jgi:hypothetical protein
MDRHDFLKFLKNIKKEVLLGKGTAPFNLKDYQLL